MSTGSDTDALAAALARADALEAELADLKLELWHARDAAMGAIAEVGSQRARHAELEAMIHSLRVELDRLRHLENTAAYRLGNTVVGPLKALRSRLR